MFHLLGYENIAVENQSKYQRQREVRFHIHHNPLLIHHSGVHIDTILLRHYIYNTHTK